MLQGTFSELVTLGQSSKVGEAEATKATPG
jgi:hypothetical protein